MPNSIPLSANQLQEIRDLTNNGTQDYWKGYNFIYNQIKNNPAVDDGTKKWFKYAPEINANDPLSVANVAVRSHTAFGIQYDNGTPIDMQTISDNIGNSVTLDILTKGAIPPVNEFALQ